MKISFCSFVSLSHFGGIEKWIINISKLLVNEGNEVFIYTLPYTHGRIRRTRGDILKEIPGVTYKEAWRHDIKSDVIYLMYYSSL